MTTIAPGGALHEGPTLPRALLPRLGFLRPVVRPVRPVLSPVLRAALPAHLRARPLLPPAGRRPLADAAAAPAARGGRRVLVAVLAAAGGAAAVAAAVLSWPTPAAHPVAAPAGAPAAAVPVAAGLRLLDAAGTDLGVVATAPAGVPQVVAGSDPGIVAGRVDVAAVTAALAVRAQLPPALAREVVAVGATSRDGVWLALRDGTRVAWGSPDRPEDKAAALAALRAAAAHAAGYDVSAPDAPALTRR